MFEQGFKMNTAHSASYQLINSLTFCVFDLETTGGNHVHDKIIEIGLVRISELKIVAKKSFLIKPEVHIPEFIQKLTNIKDADVTNAPLIEDVIDEIMDFMGDSILVAHNTSFDVPFFNSVLKRLGRDELKNKSICTNLMTKYMIPNLLSSNLNYMSKIFDLEHQKAHRALDDAMASAHLLLKYLDIFIQKNINKVNSLYYPKNKFELDRINFKKDASIESIFEKIDSLNVPFTLTIKGTEGVVLYSMVSKGSAIEADYLKKNIKNISFEMITIKLVGPYFLGLIELSSYFNKIESRLAQDIIKKLCEFNQIPFEKIDPNISLPMPSDFIILNHLIPDQYVIYPLKSLHHKLELVFRYPTHQNKLVQYINSKSTRLLANKIKKDHLHNLINNFMVLFLELSNENFLIQAKNTKIINTDIMPELENFVLKNPNNYNFPKNFL
jgi:DNA polymerase-3 subunit epsilon